MFKKEKKGILKDNDKKYTSISSYKPTGNLIYNDELFKTIQDKTT